MTSINGSVDEYKLRDRCEDSGRRSSVTEQEIWRPPGYLCVGMQAAMNKKETLCDEITFLNTQKQFTT